MARAAGVDAVAVADAADVAIVKISGQRQQPHLHSTPKLRAPKRHHIARKLPPALHLTVIKRSAARNTKNSTTKNRRTNASNRTPLVPAPWKKKRSRKKKLIPVPSCRRWKKTASRNSKKRRSIATRRSPPTPITASRFPPLTRLPT